MDLNFKLLPFPKFWELRVPTFILECPICLDYEEVILRESEQVRILVKWHHFREIRPYNVFSFNLSISVGINIVKYGLIRDLKWKVLEYYFLCVDSFRCYRVFVMQINSIVIYVYGSYFQ